MAKNNWNTQLYDSKHAYVFKYGEDVVNLLDAKHGETILDLGCGTGHLTNLISKTGADVLGIDSSAEMIDQAKNNYPALQFEIKDAADFNYGNKFDAVFSNAVLHWILEKEKVIECVYNCLKHSGRFIAEFGGKGNTGNILKSIRKIFNDNGFSKNTEHLDWYFPSIGEYSILLEMHGFRVTYAIHFDRDTFMDEGVDLINWIEVFAKRIFEGINEDDKGNLVRLIKEDLSRTNLKEGKWFVDYKRLRIAAIKEI